MLEIEKTKAMHRIFRLNRMIDELQSSLAQKRDIAHMNQESAKYDNSGNLYPVPYSKPDTNSHSIRIVSYTTE
ncbi:MAG: hypothetical protein WA667_02000 [Candidatus Nitrosopolaris sp.]